MYYDKSSLGSKAYLGLAGELLRREEQQQKAEASA
jgi:chromosome partitioning protein